MDIHGKIHHVGFAEQIQLGLKQSLFIIDLEKAMKYINTTSTLHCHQLVWRGADRQHALVRGPSEMKLGIFRKSDEVIR